VSTCYVWVLSEIDSRIVDDSNHMLKDNQWRNVSRLLGAEEREKHDEATWK
jgi:hypothetical protein